MSTGHPRLLAWKSKQELLKLRDLYTSNSKASLEKAISITIFYESKCSIPHSLTSTKLLTALKLEFEALEDPSHSTNMTLLQTSATMTLIRFVNGLLDPFQQSQYAIPLSVLAKRISLPSKFIEIRHMGTHEGLPSLEMLEMFVNQALEWLIVNYWANVETDETEEEMFIKKLNQSSGKNSDGVKGTVDVNKTRELIKIYRRIRRNDINKFFKIGDTSESGKEYWSLIEEIKSQTGFNGFYEVLIERITSSKLKFDNLKKLYEPLMKILLEINNEETGVFIIEFIDTSMKRLYEYQKLQKIDIIKNEIESHQLEKWIEFSLKINTSRDLEVEKSLIDTISKHSMNLSIELLNLIKLYDHELILRKESKIELLTSLLDSSTKITSSIAKREIDDITSDLENLKKKVRLNKKETRSVKLFEPYENWVMKPFGVL